MSKTKRAYKKYYDPSDFDWDTNIDDDDKRSKEKLKARREAKKIKHELREKELEAPTDE